VASRRLGDLHGAEDCKIYVAAAIMPKLSRREEASTPAGRHRLLRPRLIRLASTSSVPHPAAPVLPELFLVDGADSTETTVGRCSSQFDRDRGRDLPVSCANLVQRR